jgi:hypothetical protein
MPQPLLETFDTAIVGCLVVLSCIDDELKGLETIEPGIDILTWKQKAMMVWKDENIREIATQLRGQQAALGLFLQSLQL